MDSCRHPLLFLHPAAGCGDVCANGRPGGRGATVPIVQLVQWDMDLFTVLLPVLTSLVHMAAVYMVTDTLAASQSVVLPHAANHDTSDRFH